jgi:hypothetical protein
MLKEFGKRHANFLMRDRKRKRSSNKSKKSASKSSLKGSGDANDDENQKNDDGSEVAPESESIGSLPQAEVCRVIYLIFRCSNGVCFPLKLNANYRQYLFYFSACLLENWKFFYFLELHLHSDEIKFLFSLDSLSIPMGMLVKTRMVMKIMTSSNRRIISAKLRCSSINCCLHSLSQRYVFFLS